MAFADVPLILSFGPLVLKLEFDTHLEKKKDEEDEDEEDDTEDLKNKLLIKDSDTITDINNKISDIQSIIEYKSEHMDGILRYN